MEFDKDGKRIGIKVEKKGMSYVDRMRLRRERGWVEINELVDWNRGEWERGVLDSNKGMLSEKVKVGKKWYRRSDRKK